MNVITKAQNNDLYFTFEERRTLTSPFYLLKCTNRSTHKVKRFILPADTSEYPERYNKFTITENSTENLTSGVVELEAGEWQYDAYEQSSSTNLQEANATTLVESGLFKVLGTDPTYNKYNEGTDYNVYRG